MSTKRGGIAVSLTVLANELLETALWPTVDKILAPDFVVKGPHYPLLEVEIEIDVYLAILADIMPDCPGRRIGALSGRAQPTFRVVLVETDEALRIDGFALLGRGLPAWLVGGRRIRLASRPRRRGRLSHRDRRLRCGFRGGRRGWLLIAEKGARAQGAGQPNCCHVEK